MDDKSLALLRQTLKAHGYSMTEPRQFVCENLWGKEPLSMAELTCLCADDLNRASVYRIISLFEKLGIVRRVYSGWKYKLELSELFVHHHHHVTCERCGKLVVMTEDAEIERLLEQLACRYGYVAKTHQLEIVGLCAACRSSDDGGSA